MIRQVTFGFLISMMSSCYLKSLTVADDLNTRPGKLQLNPKSIYAAGLTRSLVESSPCELRGALHSITMYSLNLKVNNAHAQPLLPD